MRKKINSGTLLRQIYASATEFAIYTTELDGKINSWNIGAERILGFSKEEMLGRDIAIIYTPENRFEGTLVREMAAASAKGKASASRWHLRKDGCQFWADGVLTPIRGDSNQIVGFLKILQDITERKTVQDEISRLAAVDVLTGLPNRSSFDVRMKEMVSLANRFGHSLEFFIIDLDRFKEVNDTHGHPAGDELLRQVASRLKDASRDSDFVARMGGDEFGLLQIGPSHPILNGVFASKLVACLAHPFDIGGISVQISASVGIACSPSDGTDTEVLLKKADLALYKSKNAGRNGYHYFTEDLDIIARKGRTDSNELRRVVDERQLWLEYQPIIDARTGRTIAMEALIRFPDPILSRYTVDYAINLARQTGIICEIGAWVFKEACTQMMQWKNAGIVGVRICINTCAKELLDANYLASIEASVTETGANTQDIEIELTERDAIDLKSIGSSVLDALVASGFNLSLDDFGTGYSSLSYLRSLPVATIKLDKSFLIDVPSEPEANAVAKAIISLAGELHLQVIAEGVENFAQAQFLQQIHCEAFQGFLFSKAMSPSRATEWLLNNDVSSNLPDFFLGDEVMSQANINVM